MMNSKLGSRFQRLEDLRTQLCSELLAMQEKANLQPAGEKWSAVQVAAHLCNAETGGLQYMRKKIQAGDNLQRSGLKGRLRTMLLRTALRLPVRFKAPSVIAAPSNDHSAAGITHKWEELRKELRTFLDEVPEKYYETYIFRHPAAGKINLIQAIGFMGDHVQRHLEQVKRIRRQVG